MGNYVAKNGKGRSRNDGLGWPKFFSKCIKRQENADRRVIFRHCALFYALTQALIRPRNWDGAVARKVSNLKGVKDEFSCEMEWSIKNEDSPVEMHWASLNDQRPEETMRYHNFGKTNLMRMYGTCFKHNSNLIILYCPVSVGVCEKRIDESCWWTWFLSISLSTSTHVHKLPLKSRYICNLRNFRYVAAAPSSPSALSFARYLGKPAQDQLP